MSDATDIITLDGPAGAGKSSVARETARRLGFAFLDTGAMYRAATWWAIQSGVNLDDPAAVAAAVRAMQLELHDLPAGLQVIVGGTDISEAIRSPEITRMIHRVDQVREVRSHLVGLQRAFGERQPTVAEGRDIGTVVFPNAKCKIYLDADPKERARRRSEQLREKGMEVNEDELAREIEERDRQNMTRSEAPLKPAPGAVIVDTSGLAFDEVVERIIEIARGKLALP